MIIEKSELLLIRFTENNFFFLEFQFCMFVRGKELWVHFDGTTTKPTNITKLAQWETNDARIINWILKSVDLLIILNQ